MAPLSDLFPDGPRADLSVGAPRDDHHTVWRLREMIGEPRDQRGPARPVAETDALIRRVEAAARSAVPITLSGDHVVSPPKRSRRRVDPLTTGAAALAVLAVIAAAAVGGVQMATASPAASSVTALEADEAALQNGHQSLITTRDRIIADIASQTADAALLRGALLSTSTVPDPASDRDSAIEVTDPAALSTALAAVDAYAAGLATIVVPEAPAEYERGDIDEESLAEVGSAIDSAQEQILALDAATTEMRSIRTQLDALRPPADAAVTAYAATFAGNAEAAASRYPDADEALQTALVEAAAQVGSTSLWGAAGATTLEAYRDAFAAVAADQLRVEIERQQGTRRSSPRTDAEETTPPADTTDPGSETPDPGTSDGEGTP